MSEAYVKRLEDAVRNAHKAMSLLKSEIAELKDENTLLKSKLEKFEDANNKRYVLIVIVILLSLCFSFEIINPETSFVSMSLHDFIENCNVFKDIVQR